MSAKVCVNCGNENPINGTDNRLVTESCGHVKCMHCLLNEKSGCVACKETNEAQILEATLTPEIELKIDNDTLKTDTPELLKEVIKGRQVAELKDEIKKRKLDISHIRVEPEGSQHRYTCTICDAKFKARNQVVYHAYCNKKQKKPYQCSEPECRDHEGFSTLSHYKYHIQVHKNERLHVCEECGKKFICKSKLERHQLKHTQIKQYPCSQCNKAFNNRSALKKHNLTHTGEQPYSCQTCGMRFRDSSNYKKHVAKHSEKKCGCGSCGKGAGGCNARVGCRRGVTRRPHPCARCSMAFHTTKDLRRHMQIHTDSKPHDCKDCGRRFRRKDNLERHIRNTHHQRDSPDNESQVNTQNGTATLEEPPKNTEVVVQEKTNLETTNQPHVNNDVIDNHLYTAQKEERLTKVIDKSYIIEANHARESVIVSKYYDKKIPSPETEYVHKIRRANLTNKETTLPPIDEMKFLKVLTGNKNDLDVGPLPKNIQTYKSILHDKSEMHWKKRLADNE